MSREEPRGMDDLIGVLGRHPHSADGRVVMTISDGRSVLVDPTLPHPEIARLHGLDRVVLMPEIDFCSAVFLDGPLAGQSSKYAVNELGHRTTVASPPPPGQPTGVYELVSLADSDHPAEFRFIGYTT